MKARAIVHRDLNLVELAEVEIPAPGPGELLVESKFTCISPGTELRCLGGLQGQFPFVPGYAMAGHVVIGGPGTQMEPGRAVQVGGTQYTGTIKSQWGGHMSHAIAHENSVIPIPQSVDLLDASISKIAAIGNHGVELCPPRDGENVVVVGLGVIGQFSARLYAACGARVLGVDKSAHRVAALRAAGVESALIESSLTDTCAKRFPDGADIVVDATGVPAVLNESVLLARLPAWGGDVDPRLGPRFVIQGSYPGDFSLPYQSVYQRELTLFLPRDRQARDVRKVLELMAEKKIQARDLNSEVRPPHRAHETYAELRDPATRLMTVAFDWSL
jgi:2-desacetyl-2-hydroxyethyl bacteriochlorophyllide A dehydrogenase